jgi:hypothetical protein
VAGWDEAHMYRCLSWLYDGFQFPAESELRAARRSA